MASGLSRRRGAGHSGGGSGSGAGLISTTTSSSSSTSPDSPPLSRSSSSNGVTNNSRTHAGSAFAGGSKIAWDVRDLPPDSSSAAASPEALRIGGTLPKLTLMEEILLLGLKDKQGYLSFWNDNISYALRGCILIELALRRRIAVVKDVVGGGRRRVELSEMIVEVVDERMTGETILDETLRMMKATQDPPIGGAIPNGGTAHSGGGSLWGTSSWTSGPTASSTTTSPSGSSTGEKLSISTWVDLLSGETWNVLKIGFQLKQVRERLAKGLVDKGVLRTEKRNFLLFDMATHPVADAGVKASLIRRLVEVLTARTTAVPEGALLPEGVQCRVLRTVCLVCAAYTASVLDGAMGGATIGSSSHPSILPLGYEEREGAFARADEILGEFSVWPWGTGSDSGSTPASRKRISSSRIATGSSSDPSRESVLGLVAEARKEMGRIAQGQDRPPGLSDDGQDLCLELVAGVLEVLGRLDSLL
ncbi:Golgi phosphoprotein 3-domain-containing protein [Lentinula edodes]|uniref:Golgi phosphoprotein 3-domain-containing protein n=1 Tax=Lentinula edodes TaxID=5353 RepID=UPI001E8DA795|nr:Golgi phosphoprotein 3-domain-containing protein [Lentinula edodes]KAH7871174.1 Golgi phosphoprotein 3-domain-containing protein [Lentinula edodes]